MFVSEELTSSLCVIFKVQFPSERVTSVAFAEQSSNEIVVEPPEFELLSSDEFQFEHPKNAQDKAIAAISAEILRSFFIIILRVLCPPIYLCCETSVSEVSQQRDFSIPLFSVH